MMYGTFMETNIYIEEFEKIAFRNENISWERGCWYVDKLFKKYFKIIIKPLLLCRRMMFSLSGWLARKGRKLRTGK